MAVLRKLAFAERKFEREDPPASIGEALTGSDVSRSDPARVLSWLEEYLREADRQKAAVLEVQSALERAEQELGDIRKDIVRIQTLFALGNIVSIEELAEKRDALAAGKEALKAREAEILKLKVALQKCRGY